MERSRYVVNADYHHPQCYDRTLINPVSRKLSSVYPNGEREKPKAVYAMNADCVSCAHAGRTACNSKDHAPIVRCLLCPAAYHANAICFPPQNGATLASNGFICSRHSSEDYPSLEEMQHFTACVVCGQGKLISGLVFV